jgi:hypothetical protein
MQYGGIDLHKKDPARVLVIETAKAATGERR